METSLSLTPKLWSESLISWLLEVENPPIRYRTLTELLERSAEDPDVRAAKEAIAYYPPVADLLAVQKPSGHWVQRDYYLPKAYGTFWTLIVLADMGLSKEDEHVNRGCEFIFAHQRDDGQFCRRRRIAGKGLTWEAEAEPCTQARIVRFLIQFGYGDDPRIHSALEWLLATQRQDGMWLCSWACGRGCLRATLDFLRAAILNPTYARLPSTASAAAAVCSLLMQPNMGRYHVGEAWSVLVYPYFGYGLISALEALAELGYTQDHPKVVAAIEYLQSRRLPDGSWPLDERVERAPFDFGIPGAPNKWLTLDGLHVLKLFYGMK
jgi:hypothetical protein